MVFACIYSFHQDTFVNPLSITFSPYPLIILQKFNDTSLIMVVIQKIKIKYLTCSSSYLFSNYLSIQICSYQQFHYSPIKNFE